MSACLYIYVFRGVLLQRLPFVQPGPYVYVDKIKSNQFSSNSNCHCLSGTSGKYIISGETLWQVWEEYGIKE